MLYRMESSKEFVGTKGAARILGITRQGVAYLIGKGIMKAEWVDDFLLIRVSEVQRVAALNRKPGVKKQPPTSSPKPRQGSKKR